MFNTTISVAGTIDLRLSSFALNLNPLQMSDVESRRVATLLHLPLLSMDQDGKFTGLIARSWSKESNVWRFVIVEGFEFSNGAPISPQDVVASLCASMQPNSPWAWALSSIKHKRSKDGKTLDCIGISIKKGRVVEIEEEKPAPWFLDAISSPAGWILPSGTNQARAYGEMPGAGPYRIKEIIPDVHVALERRDKGSLIRNGAEQILFRLIADDSVAATQFANGYLDILDFTSPRLIELLSIETNGALKLQYPGYLIQRDRDRVRVAIINEKKLLARGFSSEQVRSLIAAFNKSIDRGRIAKASNGACVPLYTPFPPSPEASIDDRSDEDAKSLPKAQLTILTEPDWYSDRIAASLPKKIGPVKIDYRTLDKGLLISSMVSGDFDIASVLIEAPIHAPAFWARFFAPGSPFTIFGKAIAGLDQIDLSTKKGIRKAGSLISKQGNWIPIISEKRITAVAPGVSGLHFTRSGQSSYENLRRD